MRKVFIFITTFFLFSSFQIRVLSSNIQKDSISTINLDEVTISSRSNPILGKTLSNTTSIADKELIKTAKNIPLIVQTLPSVVSYSEDGSGIGNTSIRIRGTDATRINVSLNGMPLNNPESQEVYWVNLPDISNSLQKIEVNRGVGSSLSGTSSFGGSISMQTDGGKSSAYGVASLGLGSYNTYISSLSAGSGLLNNHLSIDGRFSKIIGNGYIRNAKVNHQSAYLAFSYYNRSQLLRLNYINGIQHTGITWEGVSPDKMKLDRKYNPAGEYKDNAGNIHYYDNETDNYYSNIVQLYYSNNFKNSIKINASSSYNHGYGYYENYKVNQNLTKRFHVDPQIIEGVEYKTSDVIRRKLMSNNFYTFNGNINYINNNLNISGGVYGSIFDGNHYGRLKWIKYNNNIPENYEWYRNVASKNEFSSFLRASYSVISNLSFYGDLQYRFIKYKMIGIDDDFSTIDNTQFYRFFNPKIGFNLYLNNNEIYASLAIANREPLRTDLKESIKGGNKNIIKPERLFDYELGYKYASEKIYLNANLYYMHYKDQMLQTGKLNDVGYKLMENVPKSYRLGIEFIGAYKVKKWLKFDANITLSKNKIKNYTAYYDLYDNSENWNLVGQVSEYIGSSNISYSPSIVSSLYATFSPLKQFNISVIGKYVGKQNYDNSNNNKNQLTDYFVSNILLEYTYKLKNNANFNFQFIVNNIFNKRYIANAWVSTDKFKDGTEQVYKGYFPQATRNIMFKTSINF